MLRRCRLFLPLSLSLALRGASALVHVPAISRHSSALLASNAGQRAFASRLSPLKVPPVPRSTPTIKNSLGLMLLLGGSASGLALQLRSSRGGGVRCEAVASSSDESPGHRCGCVNELPGGLITTEHFFALPLRHDDPQSPHIEVFVRELSLTKNKGSPRLPALLFLQGGPGFAAGRPVSAESGWIKRALQSHTVFLLDQRGTGRSTAVTWESLAALGDADEQANYIACMRADSIVKDCELIRKKLLGEEAKWTLLGQSFGGFCVMTYLSLAPRGLQAAMLTGGLPPVDPGCTADKVSGRFGFGACGGSQAAPESKRSEAAGIRHDAYFEIPVYPSAPNLLGFLIPFQVYRHTYKRASERSRRFYQRYPQHVQTVRDIMQALQDAPQPLPDGGLLTSRRFQQLGLCLGGGSGMEHLHYLLENPWQSTLPGACRKRTLSFEFLKAVESESDFETSPMYAIGHEAIYCNGPGASSSWSAQRIMAEFPEFDIGAALKDPDGKIMMTAEHVHPWMFDGDYRHLESLKLCAEKLAAKSDWGLLYDIEAIKKNTVPTAAAMYYDDIYVDRLLSETTAAMVGSEGGTPMKVWVTNEYQHSGIRDDGFHILDRLLGMLDGSVALPS